MRVGVLEGMYVPASMLVKHVTFRAAEWPYR